MLKTENTSVYGWEAAIKGMRNPLQSWAKSDTTYYAEDGIYPVVGENDLALMKRLVSSGPEHAKFLRMITVTVDITSNHFWWAEADTYKIGTVRNSCSKMHKIHAKEFTRDDFSCEGIMEVGSIAKNAFETAINGCEWCRQKYNETKEKKYWRAMVELLPIGYNLRATVQLNYQVLANIYHQRKNHKLFEWHIFCDWILSLPYANELIVGTAKEQEGKQIEQVR